MKNLLSEFKKLEMQENEENKIKILAKGISCSIADKSFLKI